MITVERTKKRDIPAMFLLYRRAFPRYERKPFRVILRSAKEGKTDIWTIRRDGKFAGLATTVNSPQIVLLDYFAVKGSLRGQGVGSAALCELAKIYAGRGLFVEIESTRVQAKNQPERERRKRFYEACGMVPMGTEADLFGTHMELLGIRCSLTFAEYQNFYRVYYSPWAAEHIRPVKEEP